MALELRSVLWEWDRVDLAYYMRTAKNVQSIPEVSKKSRIYAAIANQSDASQCFCGRMLSPRSSVGDVGGIIAIAKPASIPPVTDQRPVPQLKYSMFS